MTLKTITLATCVAVVATTALAHKGATGMLLERMNGMLAMGKATKEIAPMMRGQQDYDAARTSAYAAVLETHSGEAMLALFPEGMNMKPSVAKDSIWSNWGEFSALANDLELYAEALDLAAGNGIGDVAADAASMMGADTSTMMGADTSTMMGEDTSGMMGGSEVAALSLEELSSLPVNTLFAKTAQVCSACHSKFRADE